jgi:chromosome partitioning protein
VGCDPTSFDKTIYNALVDIQVPISSVIVPARTEVLDVAPSNVLLSGAEVDLASVTGREFMLNEQFKTIQDEYDFCVIDCPPSLGILTLNAFVASTGVVVPVQVHYYAMEGLKQLFETVEVIQEHFQPCTVRILGLLLTFVEDRLIFSRQIQQQMREFFGDLVFQTVIHRNIRLAEAPSAGQSVMAYSPDSRGAAEYMALADEIINGRKKPDTGTADTAEIASQPLTDTVTDEQQPNDSVAEQSAPVEIAPEPLATAEGLAAEIDGAEVTHEEVANA